MDVPARHILEQAPVIAALFRTAAHRNPGRGAKPVVPGPALRQLVRPRPRALIDDFVRHVGGDPAAYAGTLPPHLFPQWGFPLLARALGELPWDLTRVLNAGCRMEITSAIPDAEPLELEAQLVEVDDDGRRAKITTRLITGTRRAPAALSCRVHAVIPFAKKSGGAKRDTPVVPAGAREIDRWSLSSRAGLEFALLTGDFNPIHWVAPYARLAGFPGAILHGFSTFARAFESLKRASEVAVFDVRFVSPLVLPAEVRVFVEDETLAVGDAPGGRAYLLATFAAST